MSYLCQRSDTHLIRLLLLPSLITTALHSSYGYVWLEPTHNVFNWAMACVSFVLIGKGIDWALARPGRHKQGKDGPGPLSTRTPAIAANGHSHSPQQHDRPANNSKRQRAALLPQRAQDALELMFSMRGLGWDFGEGVYAPPPTRPQERGPFLRATLRSFLVGFLLLDVIDAGIKLVPGVGDPAGGSIFFAHLPAPTRFLVSTALHVLTGIGLVAGFSMVYDLMTLLAVAGLGHSPRAWPPVMDSPG